MGSRPGFRAATRSASRFALALTAAGVLAGVLLVIAEFTTVASVDVGGPRDCEVELVEPDKRDRCILSGFERHGGGFAILGVLAIAMAWGAGIGGSRPAGAALAAIGAVVIAFTLVFDLPEARETGQIGPLFEGAEANPGAGLYLDLVAGALAAAVGLVTLVRRPPG